MNNRKEVNKKNHEKNKEKIFYNKLIKEASSQEEIDLLLAESNSENCSRPKEEIKFDIYEASTTANKSADFINNPNLPNPVVWYRMGD